MTLKQNRIEVAIRLASGTGTNQPNTFTESGTDTVTLSGSGPAGRRASAQIENSGAPSGGSASVRVWGMTPSLMNQLSTLGLSYNLIARNTLTVLAGNDEDGLATAFSGTITAGYASYEGSPDVPFHFVCNAGLADAVAPAAASSFPGPTDVATIMSGFARQMGVGFENSGVTAQLRSPYFAGNIKTQMQACAEHAGINAEIVDGKLCIWPKGGNRSTPTPVLIAAPPLGKMISYPAFTQNGIVVKTVYDPRIAFGGLVKVQSVVLQAAGQSKSAPVSSVLPANGEWAVYKLDHNLEASVPKGQWMSTVYCFNPRYPRPVVAGPRG